MRDGQAWHWAWSGQGLDSIHFDCGAESGRTYEQQLQIPGHATLCAGQTPRWCFYCGPLASLLKSDNSFRKEETKEEKETPKAAQLVSNTSYWVAAKAFRTNLCPPWLGQAYCA